MIIVLHNKIVVMYYVFSPHDASKCVWLFVPLYIAQVFFLHTYYGKCAIKTWSCISTFLFKECEVCRRKKKTMKLFIYFMPFSPFADFTSDSFICKKLSINHTFDNFACIC